MNSGQRARFLSKSLIIKIVSDRILEVIGLEPLNSVFRQNRRIGRGDNHLARNLLENSTTIDPSIRNRLVLLREAEGRGLVGNMVRLTGQRGRQIGLSGIRDHYIVFTTVGDPVALPSLGPRLRFRNVTVNRHDGMLFTIGRLSLEQGVGILNYCADEPLRRRATGLKLANVAARSSLLRIRGSVGRVLSGTDSNQRLVNYPDSSSNDGHSAL